MARNQKAVRVTDVIIKRITIAEPAVVFLVITVARIGRLVIEDFGGILVFVLGGGRSRLQFHRSSSVTGQGSAK